MSWLMRVKIAVLAPMPRASDSTATVRKTGDLRSVRREYRKSCRMAAIDPYTARGRKGYEFPPPLNAEPGATPATPWRRACHMAFCGLSSAHDAASYIQ